MRLPSLSVARALALGLLGLQTAPLIAAPGTEFWAVYSHNPLLPLSIVVGNPDAVRTASVVVDIESGTIDTAAIPPGETHRFEFHSPLSVAFTDLLRNAYRVRSDIPVHAYQFSDYEAVGAISASLLLPAATLGTSYVVLTIPDSAVPDPSPVPSFVTIVAPGPARVTVTPTVATRAGGPVPALAPGGSFSASLDAFDVLQIAGERNADMTGTTVESTAPVFVLTGCLYCHFGPSASDGIQEAQPPLSWWGTEVVAVSSAPLSPDVNLWRILAAEDATRVTTEPPQPGTPVQLDAGEFVELSSTADFLVSASRPVLVARYNTDGSNPPVDPAQCLMIPAGLFAKGATFALWNQRTNGFQWLDIVARPGTTVWVDGALVPQATFVPIGSSGFRHAQIALSLTSETHRVAADGPIAAYASITAPDNTASFPIDMTPGGAPPWCDAGGPYALSCTGPTTNVPLSGAGSSDPEGQPLSLRWSSTSGVTFDAATATTPTASVVGFGRFDVDLEISDGFQSASCSTTIDISPAAPPPGELSAARFPLLLAKQSQGSILFAWEDLGPAPIAYHVYEGALRGIWSHRPLACEQPGTPGPAPGRRSRLLTPGPASHYYLMTAASCTGEGPSGADPTWSTCPP